MQNTNTQPPISPYEAYSLMVQDYNDTKNGLLEPNVIEGEALLEDTLRPLRKSVGTFAVDMAGLSLHDVARDIGLSVEVLKKELEEDEELIRSSERLRREVLSPETKSEDECSVDFSKIGWIQSNETATVHTSDVSVEGTNISYSYANLTAFHDTTQKAYDHLDKEGELDELLTILKRDSIPNLISAIHTGNGGSNVRPVNFIKGNVERNVNTTYPAYKIDVKGTRNRAVVLILGEKNSKPIIGLAALYDHTGQDKVFRTITI